MAKKPLKKIKSIDQDNYFFSQSIILDETIERVWLFLINPSLFKLILPKNFVNFKINQKASSFCPGDEFSFYWTGVSNISTKFVSITDNPYIKKLTLDISMNIGIYYRKTFYLYKITNNNTTLLKIILSKMPNKVCEHANFISFTKLNPDLYSSTLDNLKNVINNSYENLINSQSFIIDKNYEDSWDIITDFQKLSKLKPNIGTNFTYQGCQYKIGSFIKCYINKGNRNIFMKVKICDKNKKKNNWVYALETFGADINYVKQEIKICINKIDMNKTQISIIHIFKQVLSKDYLENFAKEKIEVMKEIKKYFNSL